MEYSTYSRVRLYGIVQASHNRLPVSCSVTTLWQVFSVWSTTRPSSLRAVLQLGQTLSRLVQSARDYLEGAKRFGELYGNWAVSACFILVAYCHLKTTSPLDLSLFGALWTSTTLNCPLSLCSSFPRNPPGPSHPSALRTMSEMTICRLGLRVSVRNAGVGPLPCTSGFPYCHRRAENGTDAGLRRFRTRPRSQNWSCVPVQVAYGVNSC